jgi:hypothetical protein
MRWLNVFWLVFMIQGVDVPMLSEDEYTYELEYELRRKVPEKSYDYDASGGKPASTLDQLPFVKINFSLLNLQDEDRKIKIYQGKKLIGSKKINGPLKVSLEMGFAVDLKEGAVPGDFTIFIMDKGNNRRARIFVEVKSNGELLINTISSGRI